MRRLVSRAPLFLGRWWLPPATILLALLLVSPSFGVGPMGDDFMHMARVDPGLHVPGFAYAPFDLFTFVSGEPSQRAVLLEEGVFGWWMAPDFRMAFWRPLSSLTHVLDHWLWPRSSVLAHAHSMLWFAALLAVLAALYARFHAPWVALSRSSRAAGTCTSIRWTSRCPTFAPWPSACPSCSRPKPA
jgi:hypothetical protein